MVRCMIVEDEALSRERVASLVTRRPGWELVSQAQAFEEAREQLLKWQPQVCFMDIEIIGGSGLELVAQLRHELSCYWVFTTAYSQHAIKAFEYEARDYLLKPYDDSRFDCMMNKLEARLMSGKTLLSEQHSDTLARHNKADYVDRLAIRSVGNMYFVRVEDIVWVKGAGNYLEIHCRDKVHLYRETMSNLQACLDPNRFVRIHRCAMINLDCLCAINSELGRYSNLEMNNGEEVRIGQSYRKALFRQLGIENEQ
ncbi:LytTR family DNA-binding domain-containing protein [Aliiglaciecola sp. CAU 1673]|uniref:LytR/AlgR family response regulator transcription factor n=1 Tax=Aliiglaciecola sp. CAU 1673 TaxID=3032595 RepID=UPI0023DCE90E|nr:LytTR family DNA-binding domain-containing protein [Aliiglaciecola sp. CAU 1673]MDF2176691.1 LytTR family DNA-binding domain-containing protein [Aliiglaciecola sp. CAU 1673]